MPIDGAIAHTFEYLKKGAIARLTFGITALD